MRTLKRISGLPLFGLLLVGLAGAAGAQAKLRFAHTISAEDSMHLAVVEFAKKVGHKTNGAIEIDVFPSRGRPVAGHLDVPHG